MEQLIVFNGVKVVLTTAETMSEVQNFIGEGDVFISVYPFGVKVIHPVEWEMPLAPL